MITISSSQATSLGDAADHRFADSALEFLRHTLGQELADVEDDVIRAHVLDGLSRCRAYNIQQTPAILQFITLMLLVARDFDQLPEVTKFLRAPGLDPDFKVELLAQLLASHLKSGEDR